MTLKVIGAGLGRTGTMSLKMALEQLLGAPCYHMSELLRRVEEHTPHWHAAARGEPVDWDALFDGYVAAVDEPVSLNWRTLCEHYPEALVILSVREPDKWLQSTGETIHRVVNTLPEELPPERRPWLAMVRAFYSAFYPEGVEDREAAKQAYLDHVAGVKAGVSPDRLLVWEAGEGWGPLCNALDLPVPDLPFPHINTSEEFRARQHPEPQ